MYYFLRLFIASSENSRIYLFYNNIVGFILFLWFKIVSIKNIIILVKDF